MIATPVTPYSCSAHPRRSSVRREDQKERRVCASRQVRIAKLPTGTNPRKTAREQELTGVLAVRPGLYILILVCSVLGAFGYKLHSESILACPADGYASTRYLAYCHAEGYGDYDRGAFWFDLEPEARSNASNAEVLFLGNSRMQFAFSTPATDSWFSSRGIREYLLGFADFENAVFAEALLSKLRPRAKVYVINLDRFFDDHTRPPTKDVLYGPDTRTRYQEKQSWQFVHRSICTMLPMLCGNHIAFFRNRRSGTWEIAGRSDTFGAKATATDGPARNSDRWEHYAALGERFLSKLPVDRQCVVLTLAPYVGTRRAEAKSIATALGLDLVAPNLEGLQTLDTSHLDRASAERWANAFFLAAGPRIRQCVDEAHMTSR